MLTCRNAHEVPSLRKLTTKVLAARQGLQTKGLRLAIDLVTGRCPHSNSLFYLNIPPEDP